MIVIREEQMIAFQALAEAAFRSDLLQHFRNTYGPALSRRSDSEIDEQITSALRHARMAGLTRTRPIAEFAAKCLLHDPEFYNQPHFARALRQIRNHPDPDSQFILLDSLAAAAAAAEPN